MSENEDRDDSEKRARLMEFLKERTVFYDEELKKAIDDSLNNNQLLKVLHTEPRVPLTDAENCYNRNILIIKKTLEYTLNDVKNAKYRISLLQKRETFENCDLPEPLEHYKNMIEDSYRNNLAKFRIVCNDGFSDFASFVELAKADLENSIGDSGIAKLVINFLFIAQGPIRRISELIGIILNKMQLLETKSAEAGNNGLPEYEQTVPLLRNLIRDWINEEKTFEINQLDLFDSLASVQNDFDKEAMKYELMKYTNRACKYNFSLVRTEIYNLPSDFEIAITTNLEELVEKTLEIQREVAKISAEIIDFHEQIQKPRD